MASSRKSSPPSRTESPNPFRALPALSVVLDELDDHRLADRLLVDVVRTELARLRLEIGAGARPTQQEMIDRCRAAIDATLATRLDGVINGTGIVLHTNLGRAPVSEAAAAAMADAARGYLSLEVDPESQRRGGRMDEIGRLLRLLTGAEATLVVNNNAAAVLLSLASLCQGRDVIVSRGEAVEIGGGFRIPDVVAQSGCRLIEVGTTNRTYVADYARAVTSETGAVLRVHPSNFRIEGFVAAPSTADLASFATEHDTILVEDLGSGALVDTARYGLRPEPTVREVLAAGAAVVTFSGDKLLGGPQAGITCGRSDLIERIERHPLARAVRADKTTLAGLGATLRHYLADEAATQIPVWAMIGADIETLRVRAEVICLRTGATVVPSISSVGGGSLPGETLPSVAIALADPQADELARKLRSGRPRVFPIIREDQILIDMRTVLPRQDDALAVAISAALE